jgi:hypothetical protein
LGKENLHKDEIISILMETDRDFYFECASKGCYQQLLKPPSSAAFDEGNPVPRTARGAYKTDRDFYFDCPHNQRGVFK